ncbi:MAG: hypothetical protein U0R69_06530 [Gaiellales bacterium]
MTLIVMIISTGVAVGVAQGVEASGSDSNSTAVGKRASADRSVQGMPEVNLEITPFSADAEAEFRNIWADEMHEPGPGPINHHVQTTFGGQHWSLTSYVNVNGQLCLGERLPGGGQGLGCLDATSLFEEGPIWVSWGARQTDDPTRWNMVWIIGVAEDPSLAVSVTYADCSRRVVPTDAEGFFLLLAPADQLEIGMWPYRVTAADQMGHTVFSELLGVDAPDTKETRDAGVLAPQPPGRCT